MFPEGDLGPNRALVNGKQGSSAYIQCLWINTPRSLEIVQTDGGKRQLFEGYAWGMGPKFQDLLDPTTLRSSRLQEVEVSVTEEQVPANRRERILGAALGKNDWRRQEQGTPHRALAMAAIVG